MVLAYRLTSENVVHGVYVAVRANACELFAYRPTLLCLADFIVVTNLSLSYRWACVVLVAVCGAGELEVRTGWLEKDDVECGTLISSIADFYDENYRRECQRWMGTPEMPPSIAKAYIIDCRAKSRAEQAKYVKYKVKVCCEGRPTNDIIMFLAFGFRGKRRYHSTRIR